MTSRNWLGTAPDSRYRFHFRRHAHIWILLLILIFYSHFKRFRLVWSIRCQQLIVYNSFWESRYLDLYGCFATAVTKLKLLFALATLSQLCGQKVSWSVSATKSLNSPSKLWLKDHILNCSWQSVHVYAITLARLFTKITAVDGRAKLYSL